MGIGSSIPQSVLIPKHRAELVAAIDKANKDPSVKAIVLEPSLFDVPVGSSLAHMFDPASKQAPSVAALADAVEASTKPVVAAIYGPCAGVGVAIALATHGIAASSDATFALPEVRAGVCPAFGSLYRLARCADTATSVRLACSAASLKADKALEAKLFDAVVPAGNPAAVTAKGAAMAAAMNPAKLRRASRQSSQLSGMQMRIAKGMVEKGAKGMPAPTATFALLQTASSSASLAVFTAAEDKTFATLSATKESRALRHIAVAEAAAARPAAAAGGTLGVVGGPGGVARCVAVLGAGTMGSGIAVAFMLVGVRVRLMEPSAALVAAGAQRVDAVFAGRVAKDTMSAADKAAVMRLLSTHTTVADAANGADIVVEAVIEDMTLKKKILAEAAAAAPPHALLASNTSSLDLDDIASSLPAGAAARLVGMHFFSPAHVMPLLENIRTKVASADAAAAAMAAAKQLRKTPVLVGVCSGFAANRSLYAYLRQAEWMVEEGATPAQIDAALRAHGMAMGPFAMADMSGLDVAANVRKHWPASERTHTPTHRYSELVMEFANAKRFGVKTGAGIYKYTAKTGNAPQDDPAATAIIAAYRSKRGLVPRPIPDDEIVERMLLAAVREAVLLATEGVVEDISVVDVCWVYGYGYPALLGGPVFHCVSKYGPRLAARLEHYAAKLGPSMGGPQAFAPPAALATVRMPIV